MTWRLALPLILVALLAGCSGGKTRPSSAGSSTSSGSSSSSRGNKWANTNGGSSSSGSAFRDDINRPQSSRYRDDADSVPDGPPPEIIAKLPEPVPKVEPRALYGNKTPYTVLGQTYNVLASPNGLEYHLAVRSGTLASNGPKPSDTVRWEITASRSF